MLSVSKLRVLVALSSVAFILSITGGYAQTARDRSGYSDSDVSTRSRVTKAAERPNAAEILRAARTVYIEPNTHIDPEYLEYKLDKLPEFGQWNLAFVRNQAKADLVIEIHRTLLNYIFTVVDHETSIVITKGKVVAINGQVAAEDISKEIIKKMRAVRALPSERD